MDQCFIKQTTSLRYEFGSLSYYKTEHGGKIYTMKIFVVLEIIERYDRIWGDVTREMGE